MHILSVRKKIIMINIRGFLWWYHEKGGKTGWDAEGRLSQSGSADRVEKR